MKRILTLDGDENCFNGTPIGLAMVTEIINVRVSVTIDNSHNGVDLWVKLHAEIADILFA